MAIRFRLNQVIRSSTRSGALNAAPLDGWRFGAEEVVAVIELSFPVATPSLNRTLGRHWSAKLKWRKQWAWMVRAERLRLAKEVMCIEPKHNTVDEPGAASGQNTQRRLALDRYGPRQLDHDNFVAGCKQLIDALVAEGFLVDDSPAHMVATYRQHVGKPYRTEVRIE